MGCIKPLIGLLETVMQMGGCVSADSHVGHLWEISVWKMRKLGEPERVTGSQGSTDTC